MSIKTWVVTGARNLGPSFLRRFTHGKFYAIKKIYLQQETAQ